MTAAEITAVGALLVSLAGLFKILFDSRRAERRQSEQFVERRDTRATRMGDLMYERAQAELQRLDAKCVQYEQRHAEDQRRIAELELGRIRREQQLAELDAKISGVDHKVEAMQTGMFTKFDRGDLNDK